MLSLIGSGIGRGIAIGKAYVLKSTDIEPPFLRIKPDKVELEVKRFGKEQPGIKPAVSGPGARRQK